TEPSGLDHALMLSVDLPVRLGISQCRVEYLGGCTYFGQKRTGTFGDVWAAPVAVQLGTDTRIPSIKQIHAPATQCGTNAHQRPPIRPFTLPRMLLALESVDLL